MGNQLTSTPWRSESNQHILISTNNGLERSIVQHLNVADHLLRGSATRLDAGLLGDECGQTVEITTAVVLLGLVALSIEPLDSREALDTEALAQRAVLIGVDLSDGDLVFGEGEGLGKLLVNWGEGLAVAAPGGEEFNQRGLAGQDDFVEVGGD